jgi:hypothetical protein
MSHDSVMTALEAQLGCYRRLAKLAEAQHEFVQQERTEELLDVLQRRQEELNRITALERQLAPVKKQWGEYAIGLSPEQRTTAEAQLAEARRLLAQITAADRDDALVLQQRKLNVGRELGQTQAARQVNRNYAAAAYGVRRSGTDVQR